MPRRYPAIRNNIEWTWRTNPRTVDRMLERFKVFSQFEGMEYNLQTKKEYSRQVVYNSQERGSDTGAQARQDKTTFEMFGLAYVNESNEIVITEVGRIFLDESQREMWSNLLLRQLIKFQVPNYTQSTFRYSSLKVFPLKLVLDLISELGSLNYYEIGLVCFNTLTNSNKDTEKAVILIKKFRDMLPSGVKRKNAQRVFNQLYKKSWGYAPRSALDKARPFSVFLEYTGLFTLSGRGDFTKIRVRDFFKKQAEEIRNFEFVFQEDYKSVSFFDKLGNPNHPKLPFEVPEKLKEIIIDKSHYLELERIEPLEIMKITNISELQKIDIQLDDVLIKQQKKKYKEHISKTNEERNAIIDGLLAIDENPESINLPALKLENLTWKSLIALDGTHHVKENFKLNPDLSSKNYAKGQGNTPEIELYNRDYILIVEVTLTRGKAQLNAEGMSVLDHTHKFIKVSVGKTLTKPELESLRDVMIKPNDNRKIIGVFVAREVDERIVKQFYISGKSPILGDEVSVIPFNIKQYITILSYCYQNSIPALGLEKLLGNLAENIKKTNNYEEWIKLNEKEINDFLNSTG